jgi:UDP-N-acetylglucosamine--N-acetylmuramyl-(pentapeptide) pyrophosphoryl-undecaprenol N-acetylglucosamine transferase
MKPLTDTDMQTALSPSEPRGPLRLVIAGGGTGGHLFPGIAIAQEFCARHPLNRVLFVGSGRPLEKAALARVGFPLATLAIEGIKGRGFFRQLKAGAKIPAAIWQAARILLREKPQVVIGVGGYSAGPVVMAAFLLRIRRALHEQNMLPGVTNRMLARFANRIYVSFEGTKADWNPRKVLLTGNPVRKEFISQADQPREALTDASADRPKPFTLAIVGGSQGAHAINLAVADALPLLAPKQRFAFIHQTGAEDEAEMQSAFARAGIEAKVAAFFDDMLHVYRQADLIICRAGATTMAEITVLGKAAILVPYPFAADNHQELNARALSDVGAAVTIRQEDLTGETLARYITYSADYPGQIAVMAAKAAFFGRPNAAEAIVNDCYGLAAGIRRLWRLT